MRLEEYRKTKGLTYTELAIALDLKKSTTYNLCRQVGKVNLETAKKVMERTAGSVMYEDLLN